MIKNILHKSLLITNVLFLTLILNICFSDLHAKTLRIGSLQYGSVNWELKLIKELSNNIKIKVLEMNFLNKKNMHFKLQKY